MENTLLNGYAFLAFLYAGIVVGLLSDLFFFLRRAKALRRAGNVLDACLALLSACVMEAAFLLVTGGALRLYGFAVIALGAALQQWACRFRICKRIVKRG